MTNAAGETLAIEVELNGRSTRFAVEPLESLLQALRSRPDLTGTKLCCEVGVCGACSVLLDGEPILACLYPAALSDGRRVVTVEGLDQAEPELTAALREAFELEGGYQCGICTPGQLVTSLALLRGNPAPSPDEIRRHLAGNLCRCTGYSGIVAAVHRASEAVRA